MGHWGNGGWTGEGGSCPVTESTTEREGNYAILWKFGGGHEIGCVPKG